MTYRLKNKNESEMLDNYELFVISSLVCLTNTFSVMPFDYVSVHFQKYSEKKQKKVSVMEFVKEVRKTKGLLEFYRGSGVRLIQYNINAYFTVALFEILLKDFSKKQ